MKKFRDYKEDGANWITLATGEFYPDILVDACHLYQPVLELFSQLLKRSESAERLFMQISETKPIWMRIQLCRVFRKYVSPSTPVEMLKKRQRLNGFVKNLEQNLDLSWKFTRHSNLDQCPMRPSVLYYGNTKVGVFNRQKPNEII